VRSHQNITSFCLYLEIVIRRTGDDRAERTQRSHYVDYVFGERLVEDQCPNVVP
jgi:hypothetical protein